MTAREVVAARNQLKAYFRGRPLDTWLPKLGDRYGYKTYDALRKAGKSDAQIIARSGVTNREWNDMLIGVGSLRSVASAYRATSRDCECGE